MTVRTTLRRGVRRLVIDITYTNQDGAPTRYRRDAEVQNLHAARAEDRRRQGLVASTGVPFEPHELEDGDDVAAHEVADVAGPRSTSVPRLAGISFREFAATSYLPAYGGTRLKPSTRRGYEVVLDTFLNPRIGSRDLASISAVVVRGLDAELVKKGLRPSSRRQMQCVIRSVLRYAKEAGVITAVPEMPKLPKTGATIFRAPTHEEVAAILAASSEEHLLALLLAVYAGLRASEVRGLKRKDVDLERGVLVVRRGRCRDVEAPPKSGHERIVPLHPRLLEALRAALDTSRGEYVTGRDGKPWSEHGLRHGFRSACRRAGVSGVRLHDLRHHFVSELFRVGAPAPVVQKLAGHEHLATTQRYAHARLSDLSDAVARLAW